MFITLLNKIEILVERGPVILSLIIGAVIFFAVNVRMLRYCYYDMRNYRMEYYIVNMAAYLLFALVCFAVYFFCNSEVYAWLFVTTKLIRYTVVKVPILYSALFFHFIGLITIFLSPIGMKWSHSADGN